MEADVADLLADWGVRELIGKSVVWLLGPFNQIHNLEAAKFDVGVTGMLCPSDQTYSRIKIILGLDNPPQITWNDGLVEFLNTIKTETTARRSTRDRGLPTAGHQTQQLDFIGII
jgi:hypothetical protein